MIFIAISHSLARTLYNIYVYDVFLGDPPAKEMPVDDDNDNDKSNNMHSMTMPRILLIIYNIIM